MTNEEGFHRLLFLLQPHLQEHVGANVHRELEVEIVMVQCLEVLSGGYGFGARKSKKQNQKGNVALVQGSTFKGTVR